MNATAPGIDGRSRHRRAPSCWFVLATTLAASLAPSASAGPVIGGFNISRGGVFAIDGGTALTTLRTSIQEKFPGVTFTGTSTLNPEFLGGASIVFLGSVRSGNQAIVPLSSAEQTALRNFVEQGGTAVLLVDNDTFSAGAEAANESVVDPFGIDVTGTGMAWPQPATIPNPAGSPISSGPFGTTSNWPVGWSGWFDLVPPEAQVLATVNQSGKPGLVVFPRRSLAACSGIVVVYADTTGLFDGFFVIGSSNDILMANTIALLAEPTCSAGICGDIDGDGDVDGADLGILLAAWGGGDRAADLNADGVVNGADLGILLSNWGPCSAG